jgi:hypothetical protein
MARKIVLVHGYSAESAAETDAAIQEIYNRLPDLIQDLTGAEVIDVDYSRWISLDDGVTLDDVSRAMQQELEQFHPHLLETPFDIVAHSTGGPVVRNWIRRYYPEGGCPAERILYLAPAMWGSGLAHIGKTLIARFIKALAGKEPGKKVLNALELGSSWTIQMQLEFDAMVKRLGRSKMPMEFVLIGSQPPDLYYLSPIRYPREEGSDGTVRASGANPNFIHLKIHHKFDESTTDPEELHRKADMGFDSDPTPPVILPLDLPDDYDPVTARSHLVRKVPFAIVPNMWHSGFFNIARGDNPACDQLMISALNCTRTEYGSKYSEFAQATNQTRRGVRNAQRHWFYVFKKVWRQDQHTPYCQLIFRIFDQHAQPHRKYSIYFQPIASTGDDVTIGDLFRDSHGNKANDNTITFYLRLKEWKTERTGWTDHLGNLKGAVLEIDAREAGSRLETSSKS